jgi:hypothetical protein
VVLWVVESGDVVVVVVVLVVEVLDCGIVVADGLALVPTCPAEVVLEPVLCPAALCIFAAISPALAYPMEDVGLPLLVCPQWSAIFVTSVTENWLPLAPLFAVADAVLPVPVDACELLMLPVAADCVELALWSDGLEPAALAIAPGWPVTWICSPTWVRSLSVLPDNV